jgi:hypothetical protein
MPLFKVAVMVVLLSNADGSIVAHASGIAVDMPACERLAAKKIADESGNGRSVPAGGRGRRDRGDRPRLAPIAP